MQQSDQESILSIFLAEAGEIVQRLFVQLEELHYGYDGQRILDDIHRGFHTIYGGAAVLGLEPLKDCAHLTDRVMERLRTRRLSLSPSRVSLIMGATSAIEAMLTRLAEQQPLYPIADDLHERLRRAAGLADSMEAASEVAIAEAAIIDANRGELQQHSRLDNTRLGLFLSATPSIQTSIQASTPSMSSHSEPVEVRPSEQPSLVSDIALAEQPAPVSTAEINAETANADCIGELIQELAWVRKRLQAVQAGNDPEALQRALLHFELVASEIENWWQAKP
ncbi:Hpt domain-containing protein [Spongiibacter sp. KMU-158]|uniref:Hpt domain-containing protein n=1 Tax=Spongiibacter pelagi TaxID=2760804 RepID=A0A927GWK1_9GAMM|nr:Hpt domain-containing protein [Spongiibacter pelagi]MBD2859022.1 Hpt domain-containing protein [Spongiibacter pelagi]